MDELAGYRPTAATLGDARAGLSLRLSGSVDDQQVARALAPLEEYLPQVLVSSGSADFKRAVGLFAKGFPRISRGLAPLLRELATAAYLLAPAACHRPLAERARAGRLRRRSAGGRRPRELGGGAWHWTQRHIQIAAALAAGAVLATAGLLGFHRAAVVRAEEAVDALVKAAADARSLGRERVSSRAVLDREHEAAERLQTMNHQDSWAIFHGTWAADKRAALDSARATLRDFYIGARLDPDESSETILRAVALTRASTDSGLGLMIRDDAARWADALRLPEPVVRDYVALSPVTWEGKLTVPSPAPTRVQPAARDLGVWLTYLDGLQAIFGRSTITPAELTGIRQQTLALLPVLDASARWDEMNTIAARLFQEAPYDRDAVEPLLAGGEVAEWVGKNRVTLAGLLGMVRDTSLDAAAMSRTNLSGLLTALGSAPTLALADTTYALTLKQRSFSFASKAWGDVVTHSRSSLLIDAFLQTPRAGSFAFFTDARAYRIRAAPPSPAKGRAARCRGSSRATPSIARSRPRSWPSRIRSASCRCRAPIGASSPTS